MNALYRYLNYQAAIGLDEVILPFPLRKTPPLSPKPAAPSPSTLKPQRMNSQEISGLKPPKKDLPPSLSVPIAKTVKTEVIPTFSDLETYWNYLNENHVRWFQNVSGIAKAEGVLKPVLAIVELSPSKSTPAQVFNGENGKMLDRMLKAIHLDRSQLYLTSVMKGFPSGTYWPRKDIVRMVPYLLQEIRLVAPTITLLMGETCAQSVFRIGTALDILRQKPTEIEGLFYTASYHPSDMENPSPEKTQEIKRKAWEDLKWLSTRLQLENNQA